MQRRNIILFKASLLFLFVLYVDAQQGFCPGGQLQSTVSGLGGNNIPTHMPSIVYQPAFNRFLVSIYNNNQILSQTQCANFPGLSVPNSGLTTFSILLSCTSNSGNAGFGLVGGIQLQVNSSVSTTVSSVNIPPGATYTNIPVVPLNSNENLADRLCTLTLQANLLCIKGNGDCFPSYNEPILSTTISTGPTGHLGPCTFGDPTCYADRDILWESTLLWIIVDASFIIITVFLIVPNMYWYLRYKPMLELNNKALSILSKSDSPQVMASKTNSYNFKFYEESLKPQQKSQAKKRYNTGPSFKPSNNLQREMILTDEESSSGSDLESEPDNSKDQLKVRKNGQTVVYQKLKTEPESPAPRPTNQTQKPSNTTESTPNSSLPSIIRRNRFNSRSTTTKKSGLDISFSK